MYFDSFSELVSMSGHGFYVWLAYGIALLVLALLLVQPLLKKKKILREIRLRKLHQKESR